MGTHAVLLAFMPFTVVEGVGDRPYFENYTVDASIFSMTFLGCVVLMILKIISQFRTGSFSEGLVPILDELM